MEESIDTLFVLSQHHADSGFEPNNRSAAFMQWLQSQDIEKIDQGEFSKRINTLCNGLFSVKEEDLDHLGRAVYSQQLAYATNAIKQFVH